MTFNVRRALSLAGVAGSLFSVFLSLPANASPDVVGRGWVPPVEFAGDGDKQRAVSALRDMAALQGTILGNTRFDRQTEQFVDELWASFERFDLKTFRGLLPQRDGDWSFLNVRGVVDNGRYNVQVVRPQEFDRPARFGEVAVAVRAREMRGELPTYLIDTGVSVGMGAVGWPSVSRAIEETLRISVAGEAAYAGDSGWKEGDLFRSRVLAMNAGLGKEDIAVLAPLWAAFPAQWDLLAKLGRFEDVVVHDGQGADWKRLNVKFRIEPEKMAALYPALANHLSNLGSLSQMNVKAVGAEGEVFRFSMDSSTLMVNFDAYVKDGYLVPVKDGRVADKPLKEMFTQAWHLDLLAEARMEILGVVTDVRDMRIGVDFAPTAEGAKTVASMTHIPQIKVHGRALGIMPTAVIDAVMPGNIDQLMHEFLAVMCEGNEGQGFVSTLTYRQPSGQALATLDTRTRFEGLNNVFAQFGMGIVNDRIIPDEQVSLELRQLMSATHEAFTRDLEAYSRIAAL